MSLTLEIRSGRMKTPPTLSRPLNSWGPKAGLPLSCATETTRGEGLAKLANSGSKVGTTERSTARRIYIALTLTDPYVTTAMTMSGTQLVSISSTLGTAMPDFQMHRAIREADDGVVGI